MTIHRRSFMKLLGISVASLSLTRCAPFTTTCYAPTLTPIPTRSPAGATRRERLRQYWLRFDELAQKSWEDTENQLGKELAAGHRLALDELVENGELSAAVADLVHEAYDGAVYHVWRSNTGMTCYVGTFNYGPASASVLVEQSQVLNQIASQWTIDPATLAKAQAALEHDMSYYALSQEEVEALHSQLLEESRPEQPLPEFEELPLEPTPEAKEASRFIIDLLMGK